MKRFEANNHKLVLYFDQIAPQIPLCVSIILNQMFKVNDAKESNVKVFDYYQPDLSQSVAYRLDTSGGNYRKYYIYSINKFIHVLLQNALSWRKTTSPRNVREELAYSIL